MKSFRIASVVVGVGFAVACSWGATPAQDAPSGVQGSPAVEPGAERPDLRKALDAPLLFVKRHSYTGIHIYDTYYKWPPGRRRHLRPRESRRRRERVEDPARDRSDHARTRWASASTRIPSSRGTPRGCCSASRASPRAARASTRSASTARACAASPIPARPAPSYKGTLRRPARHRAGLPARRPDRLPLHAPERPGALHQHGRGDPPRDERRRLGHPPDLRQQRQRVRPGVLPDGRILFGRWEYVDKNALTIQSLWTINPDGTQETAIFANNMVLPGGDPRRPADARHAPDRRHVRQAQRDAARLDRHHRSRASARTSRRPSRISNIRKTRPATRGDSCEPWPLSEDVVLFSGRPPGTQRNVIEMMDRAGSPSRAAVRSRHLPALARCWSSRGPGRRCIPDATDRSATTGRFFVQDIYRGLDGRASAAR